MKPTIETNRIRANLRLAAELGHIPNELVPVIESSLGLDYVEAQFKKKYKHNIDRFGKNMADLLDEYDILITIPFGKWDIIGKDFRVNCNNYSFDARTFRNLRKIVAANQKTEKRIAETPEIDGVHQITIDECRTIIAEEHGKIKD